MKRIALLFSVFIIGIIILADLNKFPPFIKYIYDFPNGDKRGHFVLYGLLTFFITAAILTSSLSKPRGWVTLSIGLTLALLITLEEWSQKLFSARTFDLIDLLASYLGVIVGGWIALKSRGTA